MLAQHHVFGDTEILDHAIAHALFRDIGEHAIGQLTGITPRHIVAFEGHAPTVNLTQSRNRLCQLSLSVPGHPGDPQDLSGANLQADVAQTRRAAIASTADALQS